MINCYFNAAGPSRPPAKTRGPNTGKLLSQEIQRRGGRRYRLLTPDGRIDIDAEAKWSSRVGGLIRDKVPMLWAEWSDVPDEVKDQLFTHLREC